MTELFQSSLHETTVSVLCRLTFLRVDMGSVVITSVMESELLTLLRFGNIFFQNRRLYDVYGRNNATFMGR